MFRKTYFLVLSVKYQGVLSSKETFCSFYVLEVGDSMGFCCSFPVKLYMVVIILIFRNFTGIGFGGVSLGLLGVIFL